MRIVLDTDKKIKTEDQERHPGARCPTASGQTDGVRLFVAVWPDAAAQRRIRQLALTPVPGIRLVDPQQWHVTLRFLGDVDSSRLTELIAALADAARAVRRPVRCTLGPATNWFGGHRLLQLPVEGLDELAAAVRSATEPIVPPPLGGELRFVGHLTLGRSRRRHPAASDRSSLTRLPLSATFDVEHMDLVESELTPGGARYTTVRRLSLAA